MSNVSSWSVWAAAALLGLTACSSTTNLKDVNQDGLNALAQQIDQDRLMSLVNGLVDAHTADTPVDCEPWKKVPGLRLPPALCHLSQTKSRDFVEGQFSSIGGPLTVTPQDFSGEGFSGTNIIAELPGTTRPQEIVLVGAHHDAFWQGADDNSTGVAALIEMARVLSQQRFERTIRFVAFDLEELGDLGSNPYVQSLGKDEQLTAAVVFDCIGYYSTEMGSQQSLPGLPSRPRGDFLAVIHNQPSTGEAAEFYALSQLLKFTDVVTIGSPADGFDPPFEPLLRSDHAPFWAGGQNAIFLTDTAPFRNPNYHQATDTVDTLNPPYYRKSVQMAVAALAYWAGGPL